MYISREDLIKFIGNLGFPLNAERAENVFKYFDKDGDGKVSYQDFVKSIGMEIHPRESLYFRQEKTEAMKAKDSACDVVGCWESVIGRTLFCMPHLK